MNRPPKTPPAVRKKARNCYRRKNGIPEDAPLQTRADPFNKARKGTGNVTKRVSMPLELWERMENDCRRPPDYTRKETRGEYIERLFEERDELQLATRHAENGGEL